MLLVGSKVKSNPCTVRSSRVVLLLSSIIVLFATMASSTISSSSANQCNKNVSFNQIEIIEMPYAIGDGPSAGAPISIGWDAQDRSVFTVDFFEQYRPKRRSREALRLPSHHREQL